MKLEDILNSDYLETDTPKSLIEENQNIKNIVHYILTQLENEKEVVNGSDWQSGYNNGLTRAVELLCELYNCL